MPRAVYSTYLSRLSRNPTKLRSSLLEPTKPKAGSFLEFLGLAASYRDDGGDVIASLALSETEIKRLVEFAEDLAKQDFAALATLQKLAGKQSRFGRAAAGGQSTS